MSTDNQAISIDEVQDPEIDALLNLYVELFHDREPLTRCFGFSKERMIAFARTLYAGSHSSSLSQGLCWVARDPAKENQAVGFIVCDDLVAAHAQEPLEDLAAQEAEMVSAVGALMEEIRSPIKEALALGEGVNLHVAAVGVAPGYEGKGIARRLLQTALSTARDRGFQYAFSECTSNASRILHEKCGFEVLNSVSINTFVVNGRRPFSDYDVDIHLMRKVLDVSKSN